ncbi:SH3 domain-containing protein [Brucella sp. BO2]|uniref:SH3 domain-containing protein n=1 Tax=Brucella sp. BO2 TaxID=693750 RepID=UPI000300BD05|nr:SH3 domain-containing protein [Brucella sp. BO2]QPN27090.1 SH3 domain-containing protein [Brucella sp. BO2]
MKLALKAALIALGVFSASAAQAANAISTTNLNVRTGPGTGYAAVGAIPGGAPVNVRGCTSGYGWCQVSYGNMFGWASSRYLAMREGSASGYSDNFGQTAALIGIPLIAGVAIGAALNDRHDRWDRGYWHHHRHWRRSGWRGDRPHWGGRHGGHGPRTYFRPHGGDGPHGR